MSYKQQIDSDFENMKLQTKRFVDELLPEQKRDIFMEMKKIDSRLLRMLEEEQLARSSKNTEVVKQLNSVKNMLLVTINTKSESSQALAKALINREATERAEDIQSLQRSVILKLETFQRLLLCEVDRTRQSLRELNEETAHKCKEKNDQIKTWIAAALNETIADFEEYANYSTSKTHLLEVQLAAEAKSIVSVSKLTKT